MVLTGLLLQLLELAQFSHLILQFADPIAQSFSLTRLIYLILRQFFSLLLVYFTGIFAELLLYAIDDSFSLQELVFVVIKARFGLL